MAKGWFLDQRQTGTNSDTACRRGRRLTWVGWYGAVEAAAGIVLWSTRRHHRAKIGVWTRRTARDPQAWQRVNRAAGLAFFSAGVVLVLCDLAFSAGAAPSWGPLGAVLSVGFALVASLVSEGIQ